MGILTMKGEKMMKRSSFGSRVRKRLSDITNMHSQPKSPLKDQENVLPVLDDSTTKTYVQQLLKENAVMMKLIQEKDKIIESNGVELQKLRVNLRRTQLQNWHLAQSNTQMLTELNVAKDRLKALQHDLACKDALYKAKMLDLQEVKTKTEKAAVEQSEQADDKNENKVSKTKRGRATRSQCTLPKALGATSSQQAVDKEIAENKRRCLRRQSIRLKPQEAQADLFEIHVNTPLTESLEQPLQSANSEKTKMQCEENSTLKVETIPEKAALEQPEQADDENKNKVSGTKRGRATRSQSLGASSSQQVVDDEIAENKRLCLRRQSIRLNPLEARDDLFEIDVNTLFTECLHPSFHASNSEREDDKERLSQSPRDSLPQRSSIGRPLRKATGKIQSYKDPPLNTKMRRP